MGQDRIHQFFNNVMVPLGIRQAETPEHARRWASGLAKETHNQLTHQALHLFFGPDAPRTLSEGSLEKQGLLQLFQDFVLSPTLNEDGGVMTQRIHALDRLVSQETQDS